MTGMIDLARSVAKAGQDHIPEPDERAAFYREVIAAFEEFGVKDLYELAEDTHVDVILWKVFDERWADG